MYGADVSPVLVFLLVGCEEEVSNKEEETACRFLDWISLLTMKLRAICSACSWWHSKVWALGWSLGLVLVLLGLLQVLRYLQVRKTTRDRLPIVTREMAIELVVGWTSMVLVSRS